MLSSTPPAPGAGAATGVASGIGTPVPPAPAPGGATSVATASSSTAAAPVPTAAEARLKNIADAADTMVQDAETAFQSMEQTSQGQDLEDAISSTSSGVDPRDQEEKWDRDLGLEEDLTMEQGLSRLTDNKKLLRREGTDSRSAKYSDVMSTSHLGTRILGGTTEGLDSIAGGCFYAAKGLASSGSLFVTLVASPFIIFFGTLGILAKIGGGITRGMTKLNINRHLKNQRKALQNKRSLEALRKKSPRVVERYEENVKAYRENVSRLEEFKRTLNDKRTQIQQHIFDIERINARKEEIEKTKKK